MIEDDRSDYISTNDDDMFQSILHTLFSTSASSVPLQSPSPPPPTTGVEPAAAELSGYGRYKKDIRNCIDHDSDDDTTPPVLDEGKHSTSNMNDDTTISTTSTRPPPRRRRYIKQAKKRTTNSDSLMLMSNINLIM